MNIQKNENIIKEQIVIYLNTILDCHTSKSVKFWNLVLYITHPITSATTAAAAAVMKPVWRRHLLRSTHRQQDLGSETEKHEIVLKGKWVEREQKGQRKMCSWREKKKRKGKKGKKGKLKMDRRRKLYKEGWLWLWFLFWFGRKKN